MTDGKWHHVCVTWSTRDGVWEAYQDGVKKGSGQNLSPWHPIKPGGTFILGQEQVRHTVWYDSLHQSQLIYCEETNQLSVSWIYCLQKLKITSLVILSSCKSILHFSSWSLLRRTRWEAASTSLSPSWERYQISSSGPESWHPMRSTARQPAEATSSVTSCPGRRSQWSSTAGSPSSPLTPATKDGRWTPTPNAVASSHVTDNTNVSKLAGEWKWFRHGWKTGGIIYFIACSGFSSYWSAEF